jgi:hypothetical protein
MVDTLLDYRFSEAEFTIRYMLCINLKLKKRSEPDYYFRNDLTVVDGRPGSVILNTISHKQRKYHCDLRLDTIPKEQLRISGKRIIRVRDVLFVDAQLYIDIADRTHAMKLKESKGFLCLQVDTIEYKKVLAQIIQNENS